MFLRFSWPKTAGQDTVDTAATGDIVDTDHAEDTEIKGTQLQGYGSVTVYIVLQFCLDTGDM